MFKSGANIESQKHLWKVSVTCWCCNAEPVTLVLNKQVALGVKNLPADARDAGRSLGWEDSLEKEMETHSSILAWEMPWTEDPGRLQSMGSQESDMP